MSLGFLLSYSSSNSFVESLSARFSHVLPLPPKHAFHTFFCSYKRSYFHMQMLMFSLFGGGGSPGFPCLRLGLGCSPLMSARFLSSPFSSLVVSVLSLILYIQRPLGGTRDEGVFRIRVSIAFASDFLSSSTQGQSIPLLPPVPSPFTLPFPLPFPWSALAAVRPFCGGGAALGAAFYSLYTHSKGKAASPHLRHL